MAFLFSVRLPMLVAYFAVSIACKISESSPRRREQNVVAFHQLRCILLFIKVGLHTVCGYCIFQDLLPKKAGMCRMKIQQLLKKARIQIVSMSPAYVQRYLELGGSSGRVEVQHLSAASGNPIRFFKNSPPSPLKTFMAGHPGKSPIRLKK